MIHLTSNHLFIAQALLRYELGHKPRSRSRCFDSPSHPRRHAALENKINEYHN